MDPQGSSGHSGISGIHKDPRGPLDSLPGSTISPVPVRPNKDPQGVLDQTDPARPSRSKQARTRRLGLNRVIYRLWQRHVWIRFNAVQQQD